jgi:hypothetical protein
LPLTKNVTINKGCYIIVTKGNITQNNGDVTIVMSRRQRGNDLHLQKRIKMRERLSKKVRTQSVSMPSPRVSSTSPRARATPPPPPSMGAISEEKKKELVDIKKKKKILLVYNYT